MRYDNLSLLSKFLKETPASSLPSLYFLISKEPWDIEEAAALLLSFLLPKEQKKESDLFSFDASQLQEGRVASLLGEHTLFSKRQLIWLKELDKAKKSVQEKIEKSAGQLKSGDVLLLSATSFPRNGALYKLVEKEGCLVDLPELKPWEREKRLIEWASKKAKQERKMMAYPVLEALVKRAQLDPYLLASEMEKLFCYGLDLSEITLRDLEALGINQEAHTVWQLGEAVFRRLTQEALEVGFSILMQGQALLPLLRQMRTQFQTGYQLCFLIQTGQKEAIAKQFPYMKGSILERNVDQASRYGLKEFKRGILAIDECEKKVKNSVADEALLLELLIYELTSQRN